MLKLKKYSFKGIGRFVEEQTIDLQSRDNLIQIDGENTNTGGSSGAGKSTTVEALAYLLGISEISATQLQSRITKTSIWVSAEFEDGITITRSKKDGLVIVTPEETVSGNSKLAEEKLDSIIGVSRKLLKTMCYKRQKQGGFFLNLTPKESHNFLTECLDLKEYQSKTFKLEDAIKNSYNPNKIRQESAIVLQSESIENLKTILSSKKEPEALAKFDFNAKDAEIAVIDQSIKNDSDNFNKTITGLGAKPLKPAVSVFEKEDLLATVVLKIEETKHTVAVNVEEKGKEIAKIMDGLIGVKKQVEKCTDAEKQIPVIELVISKKQEDLKHLDAGNCNTCKRDWDVDPNKILELNELISGQKLQLDEQKQILSKKEHFVQMEAITEGILDKKHKLEINTEELKTLNTLEDSKRVLMNEKDNLESSVNQEYLEKLNKWNNMFNIVESEYKKKEKEQTDRKTDLEHQKEKAQSDLEHHKIAMETYKTDVNSIESQVKKYFGDLTETKEKLIETEKNILLSQESIRLIKTFTLQKFQDTLNYIGDRATEIINGVPNMSGAVIYFDNAKETKSGNIKNEVNAVINLEGDIGIPIKTLSGGERSSADFAIDLAVGEMIETMTKKGVDFLIIDEGFDGLDSISKIECMEILKNVNSDKKILIVDHSSEVKEMVGDIIKVKRIKEESFVI